MNDDTAQHVTGAQVREHHDAWEAANPDYKKHITPEEALSGGVPATMPGSQAYW